jgi:hypothetical protein
MKPSNIVISTALAALFISGYTIATPRQLDPQTRPPVIMPKPISRPKIQLAILLDTSGSMDGLINQTRQQLWQVVNEFRGAKRLGMTPVLEVALFEYGNDGNARSAGFVRQLSGFTTELDRISEGLFSLTTNGGSEYCGYAIHTAVNNLRWSSNPNDLKTLFIAGNEPFSQGPIQYQFAIQQATQKGISINTIHAGDYQTGVAGGWQTGALMAGGDYMNINHNQQVVHIAAPQDSDIARLNSQLNQTYVPYGKSGKESAKRQQKQDSLSSSVSTSLLAERAKSKASSYYKNTEWDLVDAVNEGTVELEEVAQMPTESLPAPMQKMEAAEKKAYIQEQANKRAEIQQQIAKLGEARSAHIQGAKKAQKQTADKDMSEAMVQAIRKLAKTKQYEFQSASDKKDDSN